MLEARRSSGTPGPSGRDGGSPHSARPRRSRRELGFAVFTDGELRRRNFMTDFTDAVEGFDLGDSVARTWKAGEAKDAHATAA